MYKAKPKRYKPKGVTARHQISHSVKKLIDELNLNPNRQQNLDRIKELDNNHHGITIQRY